jgi:hypothetical protein
MRLVQVDLVLGKDPKWRLKQLERLEIENVQLIVENEQLKRSLLSANTRYDRLVAKFKSLTEEV